jgi:hypothetical protein
VRDLVKIARAAEMDRLCEQRADVAILPHFLAPRRVELIQKEADGWSRSVSKRPNKSWSRFIIANKFCDTCRAFTRQLHGEALSGVLGKSLLDLERCLETIASRVDRPSHGAKDQRRLGVVTRRVLVRKRFQRASERAVLEPEPCAARSHVQLIVERVGLSQSQRLLFAMKDLVHDQTNAGEAISRERERDHRPRSTSPRKRRVGDVLVFWQCRYVGVAQAQEMFLRDSVVRDDEPGLPVDQGNGAAETPAPQRARIPLTRGPGVAKRRERPCGV